jgi:hypothetical protein
LGYQTRSSPGRCCRALLFPPGIPTMPTQPSILSHPGTPSLLKHRSCVHVIVRNALEKIVRISGGTTVAHYKIQNGFASSFRLLPLRVDPIVVASLHTPPSLHRLSPTSPLLRGVPPLGAPFVLSPSWFMPLVASPFASAPKVPMFRIFASPEIKPPICRIPFRP